MAMPKVVYKLNIVYLPLYCMFNNKRCILRIWNNKGCILRRWRKKDKIYNPK